MPKLFNSLLICVYLFVPFTNVTHASEQKAWVYVVSNGDSLWNITSKFLTKIDYYSKLQQFNNIKYPKKIQPGSVIRIPMEWIKHAPASARVSFVQGENTLFRNNALQPITKVTNLVLGDEIRTGENGSISVLFADGSEMVLFKNTTVAFDHLSVYGQTGMVDTRVRIIQGKVETNAKKSIGPGSRLDISTPSAISSVRGTVYRVANTANNISTVEVIEGIVDVASDLKAPVTPVETKEGTRVEVGSAPTEPVPLLMAPTVLTNQTTFDKTSTIKWERLDKAEYYNVQISPQEGFKGIIWDKSTTTNFIKMPKLADGIYYVRITAVDVLGLEGLPSKSKFKVKEVIAPEVPIEAPKVKTSFDNNAVNVSWKNLQSHQKMVIQLANDINFTDIVNTQTLDSNTSNYTYPTDKEIFIRYKVSDENTSLESQWSEPEKPTQANHSIFYMLGFLLLVIFI